MNTIITAKFELSDTEKQALRLWCLKTERDLPIQLYNWLLKAESHEDLELRKTCVLVTGSLWSPLDQYNWVKSGIIPEHILKDTDYPALESEPRAMLFDD